MIIQKRVLLLAIGVCLSLAGHAQQDIIKKYQKTFGDNALIYNGELETVYPSTFYYNRPYLDNMDYMPGEMVYGKNWYGDLRLRFNLHEEQLVVLVPEKEMGVNADMRKVSRFTINGKQFFYFKELPAGVPEQGYIQLLFDGKQIKLLMKRKCTMKSSVIQNNISYLSFEKKDKYYIYFDGVYYPFTGKRLLYKILPQYKKELKRYIKESGIDFRENREQAFYMSVEHLQSLITQAAK